MSAGIGSPTLEIPAAERDAVAAHLEAVYPEEGCGVLLGQIDEGARIVEEAVRSENAASSRSDRYVVDPDLLLELTEREERGGPAVIGFYHSHPDSRPEPSDSDRTLAWPWYHYLIVSVVEGSADRCRLWEFPEGERAPVTGAVRRCEP